MIDIKELIKNPQFYKNSSKKKGLNIDSLIDELIENKIKLNYLLKKRDEIKHTLNTYSKKNKPSSIEIQNLRNLKVELKKLENEINELNNNIRVNIKKIPNPPLEDVPQGNSDKDNIVIKESSLYKKDNLDKDYLNICFEKKLINIERASKVSGSRFFYLENKLVFLQLALLEMTLNLLTDREFINRIIKENNLSVSNNTFTPILPPVLIKYDILEKLGYIDDNNIEFFKINDDNLVLVGTSEHSLVPYFTNEILDKNNLPIRFIGFSSCFRREAGSYGKDVRGIIRVHQFDKIEMVSFTFPENSLDELYFLLKIEEELVKILEIPYRIVERCTGDLGHPIAKGFDIECWLPSQQRYIETHSCSTTTDYQSRRLNIKYKDKNKLKLVHILNATALAMPRIIACLIENHYNDGLVKLPKTLNKYLSFDYL
jgi:seryl-tRNA synthetase